MARAIEGRLRVARARADEDARASRRARWGVGLLVAGLAAILLFILWPGETPPSETPAMNPQPLAQNDLVVEDDDVIRLKGATRLTVFRRGDGGAPERLQPGALVEARDVLQLQYTLNEGRHGVILSIDGRGAVTLHHPVRAEGSTALRRGTHALDFSYTLDDAPDFERFFFITADTPISVSPILRRARELAREPARASRAPLNLAAPLRQHSILVRKP